MAECDENLRAWWAVKTMSEALGADLSSELRRGAIGLEEISSVVLACEACAQAECCKKALRASRPLEASVIAACPNKEFFEIHRCREDCETA